MTWRHLLAGAAALLGAAAPFARGRLEVAELARAVAAEEDHIAATELARWLRDGRPHLRVIDVRTASEYAAYHIPGAEHVALADLPLKQFGRNEAIVLYSEYGVHAGQGWVFLRALGHRRVLFLRGGLREWIEDVLDAGSPRPPQLAADHEPVPRGRGC